jgi:uncharacterized repeat protein (TIGR01451 family)
MRRYVLVSALCIAVLSATSAVHVHSRAPQSPASTATIHLSSGRDVRPGCPNCVQASAKIEQLADEYALAGKPVVFIEQNVDTPVDESRKNRWWRSCQAWGGGSACGLLPWVMTDGGYNVLNGYSNPGFVNNSRLMIEDSLGRTPKAEISAEVGRVGNSYQFEVQVTNLSGVTLSPSNEATVYAIIYEVVSPDYVNYLTSRYVRATASTGISYLADGATGNYSLDTPALSGVDWARLHPVVLVDYRPDGPSGYYDVLQAAFEYSTPSFEVHKYAEPEIVNPGEPLTYTIQLVNTSELQMTGGTFTVTDVLPDGVTYAGPTVWTPFTLSPGSIWETTFVVTVTSGTSAGGMLTNEVVVTGTQGLSTRDSVTVNKPPEKVFVPIAMRSWGAPAGDPWQVIVEEDFEGMFPGSWTVDDGSTGYQWGQRACKPYAGTNSAWVVGGGTAGSALPYGTHTVMDELNTTMTYGPFSLSDASEAQLKFNYWFDTDVADSRDLWFCADFSTDGTTWNGESCIYGNSGGWREATFDMARYGVVGADQVWVRIVAYCPSYATPLTLRDGGIFVDNVLLRKR